MYMQANGKNSLKLSNKMVDEYLHILYAKLTKGNRMVVYEWIMYGAVEVNTSFSV